VGKKDETRKGEWIDGGNELGREREGCGENDDESMDAWIDGWMDG
jgi:hypothetical protein